MDITVRAPVATTLSGDYYENGRSVTAENLYIRLVWIRPFANLAAAKRAKTTIPARSANDE
jgi:hypothetical protein